MESAPRSLADALIGLIGQAYWDAYSTIAVLQSVPEPTDFEAVPVDASIAGPRYITFSSSHQLVVVPEVRDTLLDAWGIDAGVDVGEFSREQNAYLDYHRVNVFKNDLVGH